MKRLEFSGAVRLIYRSLGVKRLTVLIIAQILLLILEAGVGIILSYVEE